MDDEGRRIRPVDVETVAVLRNGADVEALAPGALEGPVRPEPEDEAIGRAVRREPDANPTPDAPEPRIDADVERVPRAVRPRREQGRRRGTLRGGE
jgi:hypothetical protein